MTDAVVRETYAVLASTQGDDRMAVYMTAEPNIEVARSKANELWGCADVTCVELHAETVTRLARKRR